jgi:hypothetical protein
MSFDAYRVAVKISLIDNVTRGLFGISKQLKGANADAAALQRQLASIKSLGIFGAAAGGAGFAGLALVGKALKAGTEYTHQLSVMNLAGMKHAEIATAVGDAWKTTGEVMTTTATENLRTLLDLKNVFGDMGEARMALPIVSRIQAVLASSSEGQIAGNAKGIAYGMVRALDIIGAAGNKADFESQAEQMSKVIMATQGRVTPEAFKSVFQYARQAKYRLSDTFKYEYLPSLIQENASGSGGGGGSKGVGPMLAAFYRWSNQGFVNRASMPELANLGLINANTALRTTTSGTTVGPMKGASLAASDPFLWVQKVLVPAIQAKYGQNLTRDQLMEHVNAITRGNQLAGSLVGEFAFKAPNFYRDAALIRGTMSTADAYTAAMSNDPNTVEKALGAQWTNFKTALTMTVVPALVPALAGLSSGLQSLAKWMRENQTVVKILVGGFTALSASLAIGGTILATTAAFKGLGLAIALFQPAALAGAATSLAAFAVSLGSIAAVAGAGYAGYQFGGWLNGKIDSGISKLVGHDATLGTAIFDMIHRDEGSKYIASASGRRTIQVNTKVNLDGRSVGNMVSTHLANGMTGPGRSASFIDAGMSPIPVGIPTLGDH